MNASRVLLISLLMLTGVWAKPTWAQAGSTPAESAPAAGVTTPGSNSHADLSSDWKKRDVKVPNVVGLWRDEAILDLFKAGLRIGDVREETSTSVADHHVISEFPAAGTEAKGGSKVDLVIARAPDVTVPDVVGLTLSAAKAALDKVDLKVGRIEARQSTTVAAGLIISQHPPAGTTVREDRRVRLVVSKGTSEDTVPNVVGDTQAAAATAIASAHLTVGTVTLQSSVTVAVGLVISESPTAGTSAPAGSAVNLIVSSGVPKVVVPNVVGLNQAAASTAITGAGLAVGAVTMQSSATVADGLVISESPVAGTSVATKSAVNLVVSSGAALVVVPNVVGATQAAATATITSAGLTLGTVTTQSSATVAIGLVISESPVAGTSVATKSAVNLVVSSGAALVVVPNVVGATQAAATATITSAGLTLGTVTTQSSATVAIGLVISESPSAGTKVVSGSPVNIVVSSGTSSSGAPVAVIVAPTAVTGYAPVSLNGASSVDPTASIQSYAWTQTAGPTVTLTNAKTALASFTAPQVTAVTALTFKLTVIDSTGATNSAVSSINVSPASTQQLAVAFVDATFLVAIPPTPHTSYAIVDGPPLAGSTSQVQVTLSGALLSTTFTVVDANGNVLSTPNLTSVGTSSFQPLQFVGSIGVPTVPFRIAAKGTTADGQNFAVQLAQLITPMNLSIGFLPAEIALVPGASATGQLTIYNGGASATFTIQYNDPASLLSSGTVTSIVIGGSTSASVPVTVTYPTNTTGVVGPTVTATASVNGDPTRMGTATLTLWQGVAP